MPRKFVSSAYLFVSNPSRVRFLLAATLLTLSVLQMLTTGHPAFADGGGGGAIP
jgi:hypothetical protein